MSCKYFYQIGMEEVKKFKDLGGNSQNFLLKFIRFFVTLGLKILRLFRFKVVFEANVIKR